jgi:hypothetical protein
MVGTLLNTTRRDCARIGSKVVYARIARYARHDPFHPGVAIFMRCKRGITFAKQQIQGAGYAALRCLSAE